MTLAGCLFVLAAAQGFLLAATDRQPGDSWAPLVVALGTALAAVIASVFAGLASLRAGKAHDTAKAIKADLVIPSEPGVAIGTAMEHVKQGQAAMVDVVANTAADTARLNREVFSQPGNDRRQPTVDTAPPEGS